MRLHRVSEGLAEVARIAAHDRLEEGAREVPLAVAGGAGELLHAIGSRPFCVAPADLRFPLGGDDREAGTRLDARLQRVGTGVAADRAVRPLDGETVGVPVVP